MRRRLVVVIGVLVAVLLAWVTTAGAVATYVRIGGTDRFDTAVVVANQLLTPPVTTVYVASGDNFPDALTAGAAAAHVGGPVLLTHGTTLPDGTKNEIVALKPTNVVIVGGPAAVSDAVKAAIAAAVPTATVVRIGASVGTRYDTAVALSKQSFSPNVPILFVANGLTFPDSLAGSAAAGTLGGPVLLAPPSGPVSQSFVDEIGRLHPKKLVLLGGYNGITQLQGTYIGSYASSATVSRESGDDRYGTAVAVSQASFSPGVASVFLTSGETFPDGLAAGAIAGGRHVPLLLTRKDCLPQAVADEISRLNPAQVYVVGGTGSVAYPLDVPPPICT